MFFAIFLQHFKVFDCRKVCSGLQVASFASPIQRIQLMQAKEPKEPPGDLPGPWEPRTLLSAPELSFCHTSTSHAQVLPDTSTSQRLLWHHLHIVLDTVVDILSDSVEIWHISDIFWDIHNLLHDKIPTICWHFLTSLLVLNWSLPVLTLFQAFLDVPRLRRNCRSTSNSAPGSEAARHAWRVTSSYVCCVKVSCKLTWFMSCVLRYVKSWHVNDSSKSHLKGPDPSNWMTWYNPCLTMFNPCLVS